MVGSPCPFGPSARRRYYPRCPDRRSACDPPRPPPPGSARTRHPSPGQQVAPPLARAAEPASQQTRREIRSRPSYHSRHVGRAPGTRVVPTCDSPEMSTILHATAGITTGSRRTHGLEASPPLRRLSPHAGTFAVRGRNLAARLSLWQVQKWRSAVGVAHLDRRSKGVHAAVALTRVMGDVDQ